MAFFVQVNLLFVPIKNIKKLLRIFIYLKEFKSLNYEIVQTIHKAFKIEFFLNCKNFVGLLAID
jgi:hypothetical protein